MPPELKWLPEESVYSLCSRYHVVNGYTAFHQTTQDIFQHHYLGSSHDLPTRLDYFAARFNEQLGTAEEIATQHTILPFFHGFRDGDYAADSVAGLTGKAGTNLKYRLGLLTGNQGASHPLKSCSECVTADRDKFGVSYWHLNHQIPGAAMCSIHRQPLLISLEKAYGYQRFGWVLPEYSERPSLGPFSAEFVEQSIALQGVIEGYFSEASSSCFFAPYTVALACAAELKELGHATKGGSYRWEPISERLLDWLDPLIGTPYISYLPRTPSQAGQFVAQTVRAVKYGRQTHPLNNLIVICWLFGSWANFVDKYDAAERDQHSTTLAEYPPEPSQEAENPKEREVLELLKSGSSIRQAALTSGVDIQAAVCWAKAAGHDFTRRGKSDKAAGVERATQMLNRGKNKDCVVLQSGLSIATINRLIRSDPSMQLAWINTQHERRKAIHRHYWSRLGQFNPDMTTQQIRVISPASYSWLYRNDREWLMDSNKRTNLGSSGNYSSIQWDKRDRHYAEQIYKAAEKLHELYAGSAIPQHEIRRAVPEISKKLSHLSRLPLTHKALTRVT